MARNLKAAQHALPPQNLEAEESVLGAMMITPNAITDVVERLSEGDFYRDSHRRIYASIVELFNKGEAVDPVTVSEHLITRGVLEEVGGKAYIHTLMATVPATANAARYAEIVRENAILRSLIQAGNEIAQLGYERPGEVRDLLDKSEQIVFDISQSQIRGEFQPLKQLVGEQFERIEKLHSAGKKITGVPSGLADLDKLTSGFQKSNLVILAARPSMGKTALALDIAQHVALKEDIPVAVFSLEMSCAELAQRMMCKQGRVNGEKLRRGEVGANDWAKLTDACDRLSKAPIFVDDSPGINMLEIRAKSRRLASKHDLGLVIVDYLQLMMSDGRFENRQQEIAKISRSLKVMARELDVPVLAVSQLSRAPEARTPPKPVLSDLRESGAIEQDADLVLFIFRERDEGNNKLKSSSELFLAKHRNGPIGTVNLVFREEYASFSSEYREYSQA